MAVLLNTGDRQTKAGTFDAVQTLSASTATTRQRINPYIPVTTIAGSTSTSGPNLNNLFTVPGATATEPPVEGMMKVIKSLGTGPAAFIVFETLATGRIPGLGFLASATVFDNAYVTATGAFVFTDSTHYLWAMFLNQQWHVVGGLATFGTGT